MENKYDWENYKVNGTYHLDGTYKIIFENDNFFFLLNIGDYNEVLRLDPKGNKLKRGKGGFLPEVISKLSLEEINKSLFEFSESYRDISEYEYCGEGKNLDEEELKIFLKRKGKEKNLNDFLFEDFFRHKKHPQIVVSYYYSDNHYEHDWEEELREALEDLPPSVFARKFFGLL